MEWDRRHSAFLYQLLSGGQLMYRDKLHYEALIRAKQHTSPKTLDRASSSVAPPHVPRGGGHVKMPSNGTITTTMLRAPSSTDKMALRQSSDEISSLRSTTSTRSTTLQHRATPSHLSHQHRGHQRRPSAPTTLSSATSSSVAAPTKEEVLRDRRMEAKLLAIKLCWEIIAWSNEGWVWVALSPIFLVMSFFYLDPATIAKVKYLYIMLLVDILLTGGIKYATKRTRPSYNRGGLFVGPDIFSFPSGHSSRAMLLVHVSIFVFGWRSLWSNVAVLCWAMLVAISRLALGRHFLTDVMGGLTLGALEFWVTFVVLQRFLTIP